MASSAFLWNFIEKVAELLEWIYGLSDIVAEELKTETLPQVPFFDAPMQSVELSPLVAFKNVTPLSIVMLPHFAL